MEYCDIYNEDRIKTGKIMSRDDKYDSDDYFLVVHVCIFNDKNEMLIQQRQSCKKYYPNIWDVSVAGRSLTGENSRQAAERETREELGYDIDLSNERPFFTMNFDNGFDDYYLVDINLDIEKLHMQEEEVQDLKWASKEEILDMVKNEEFIDYYFLDVLFEMRKQRGSYRIK